MGHFKCDHIKRLIILTSDYINCLSLYVKKSNYRESNTEIQEFATKHNITDYKELESLFIQKLFAVLDALPSNKTYVGMIASFL